MSLCPAAADRAAMPDAEFWEHVLLGGVVEPTEDVEPVQLEVGPCLVCGESGACSYDVEGRPLIHTTEEDSDE